MSGKHNECPRFNPDALRTLRRARRLSRKQLGKLINRNRQVVLRWETGETPPTARGLRSAAHVLRVQPAALLHPLQGTPTLADLRMHRALTDTELAVRSAINLKRLRLWELTGRLGADDEHPLLLAAFLGFNRRTVEQCLLTGLLPESITFRLAHVLHTTPEAVQAAFDRTAALRDAAARSEAGAKPGAVDDTEMQCAS